MATIQNVLLQAKINEEVKNLFIKTGSTNVICSIDGVERKLSDVIADIYTELSAVTTSEAIQTLIAEKIAEIVDGAPDSLDTLRELAQAMTENDTLTNALNEAIGNKVAKEDGKSLISDTLITSIENLDLTTLANVTSEKVAKWDLAQANVIESVKVNGEAQPITNKGVELSIPVIGVGETVPADIKEGDLFFQICED